MPFRPERVIIADQPGLDPDERTRTAEKPRKAKVGFPRRRAPCEARKAEKKDSPRFQP